MKHHRYGPVLAALATLLVMSGCAGTAPKAVFSQTIATEARVAAKDEVKAVVTAQAGVEILDTEKTRLAQRVEERINAKKRLNTGLAEGRSYRVELLLTRYTKGNAFARAMLAGLGQIHIDGAVTIFLLPENKQVSEFKIKKTFAWGGIYGGATGIEDIERTFADGIAAAATGQAEDPPKAK